MGFQWGPTDNRGISEIYGTILIISLVFVVAVLLVGIGFFVLDDTTSDANDRLAQDSVLELNDRLTELTADQVENSITWRVPEGTADDFEAYGNRGAINVTVRTNSTYWNWGNSTGMVDSPNQTTHTGDISLGTITHTSEDGVLTVYQGGGVLEVQDGTVTVLREPALSVSDGNLNLDFVNLTSIDQIDGSELTATQSSEQLRSNDVQQIVDAQMRRDGDVVAPASINITITSEFADGWGKLVERSVESRPVTVWESNDLAELGDDQVKIGFGEFGDGIALPDETSPYDSGVIYSGIADLAPELYNDTSGTILQSGDGFNVTDPPSDSKYTVGLRYDHDGDGANWWKWKPDAGEWENIEDPTASTLAAETPDPVTDLSGDRFEMDDEAWTCVVRDNADEDAAELKPYVNQTGKGCLVEPVGIEDPDDSKATFQPYLAVVNGSVDEDGPSDGQLEYRKDDIRINATVENTGTGPTTANDTVGVFVDPDGVDPWVGAGTRLAGSDSLAVGEQKEFTFTYEPNFVGKEFRIGVGTPDDAENGSRWEVLRRPDAEQFEIQDVTVLNSPIVEGDSLELEVNVTNVGNATDQQDLILADASGRPQATKTYTLDDGESKIKTVEWDTGVGDRSGNTTVSVSVLTDSKTGIPVNIQPANGTYANFRIEDVRMDDEVTEGDDLDAEVDLKNTGGAAGTRTIRLRDESGVIRGIVEDVTLDSTKTVTLGGSEPSLTWGTELGDAGEYNLTVETDDDTATETGIEVTTPTGLDTFNVSVDESEVDNVTVGDTLEVPAEIEYNGGGSQTESVWLGNPDDKPVDSETVELNTSVRTTEVTLEWETDTGDDGVGNVSVNSLEDSDEASAEIKPADERPEYTITSFSTNSSYDGSLPPDPTVEGEDLEIDLAVNNTGDIEGTENVVIEYAPESRAVATKEVTIDNDGGPKSINLTWETVIGDNTTTESDPQNTEDLVAKIAGKTATEAVFIDEHRDGRGPVDAMFVLDESGSMGAPDYYGDWMEASSSEWFGPGEFSGDFDISVPDDLTFTDQIHPDGEEFWYVRDDYQIYEDGDVLTRNWGESKRVWAGKAFTSEVEVPEDADMWYALPETNGSIDGTVLEPDTEGEFYVSGQTVDPADHGGTAYVLEFEENPDCGLCFDPTGERYDAVLTALDSLNTSIDDRAGLVEFTETPNVYQSLTANLSRVEDSLRINPGGGTDITEGLFEAQSELNDASDPNNKNIILLTDGQHNGDSDPPDERADDIDDDVTVYVVGFGNADLSEGGELAPLADAGTGSGKLYNGNEESLEDIFDDIGEELDAPSMPNAQVSTNDSFVVREGNTLEVPVGITNTGSAGERIITLTDFYGNIVDSTTVTLAANESRAPSDDDAPVLEWTADLQAGDEPVLSDELLVRSPASEAKPTVKVTERQSEFVPKEIYYEPDDPQATEEIEVTATIRNQNPDNDTQTVVLRDGDDNPVDVQTLSLNGYSEANVTFSWQTQSSDAGTQTITVETEDDNTETETLTIDAAPGTRDDFEVDITGTNAPITAGEELDAEIEITNNGSDAGTQYVELRDFDNRTVDLVEITGLSPGNSVTRTLTWNTTVGDGDTDDIWAVSQDDTTSETVSVDPVTGPDATFEIRTVDGPDTVEAGDSFDVRAAVENTGTDRDEQFVTAEFDGVTKVKRFNLSAGQTNSKNFTFGTRPDEVKSPTEFDINVSANNTESTEITLEPAPGTAPAVAITHTDDPITAGENLTVYVEVDNLDSASALSLTTPYGSTLEPATIRTVPAGSGNYTLTWATRAGQGAPDPQEITARVQNESDSREVLIEEAPEGDVVAPGTGPDSNPVGIDIDEIEIE